MATFEEFLEGVFGAELERFVGHDELPSYVRANTRLTTAEGLSELLASYGVETRPVGAPVEALEVVRSEEKRTPGVCLHQYMGYYVMQSLGSMLPPLLLEPGKGERVLDLCAAPGSKTTQLALMMGDGHLWANDVSGRRLNPLASALDALSLPNVSVLNSPGERLPRRLGASFDRVLADVPCSGLGRRENLGASEARWLKKGGASTLPDLQYRLLLAALKMVKPGGRVVYSTCSLDPAENEAVVNQVVTRLPVKLVTPRELPGLVLREGRTRHGVEGYDPSLSLARRLTPYENATEGFFAAVLEKEASLGPRYEQPVEEEGAYVEAHAHDDPEVSEILDGLAALYGLERSRLSRWRYQVRLKQGKMTALAPQLGGLWRHASRHGVSMAVARRGHWRLSHGMIQRLGEEITDNRVDLDAAQLRTLVEEGEVTLRSEQTPPSPHPAVAGPGLTPFTSGLYARGQLRWKRPRRYVLPHGW